MEKILEWLYLIPCYLFGCLIGYLDDRAREKKDWKRKSLSPFRLQLGYTPWQTPPIVLALCMENKTKDYQTVDGNVKFELSLAETLSKKTTYRYVLNGWVEGFGPRTKTLRSDWNGPYECQYWLKGVLPQEVLDTITFDSESSEFYIYSSDRESLSDE